MEFDIEKYRAPASKLRRNPRLVKLEDAPAGQVGLPGLLATPAAEKERGAASATVNTEPQAYRVPVSLMSSLFVPQSILDLLPGTVGLNAPPLATTELREEIARTSALARSAVKLRVAWSLAGAGLSGPSGPAAVSLAAAGRWIVGENILALDSCSCNKRDATHNLASTESGLNGHNAHSPAQAAKLLETEITAAENLLKDRRKIAELLANIRSGLSGLYVRVVLIWMKTAFFHTDSAQKAALSE